jgi:hypothetical protein
MKHLSDDQLMDRIYGIGQDDNAHLTECAECSTRLQTFERRRRESIPVPAVSSDFLAAQRRGIYARTGERTPVRLKWAPAALAACLLAVVMLAHRPAAAPPPAAHPDTVDAQLFSEVYSMEESTEPRAASPLHELFEDNQ